jgi:NADH:ubiquinone oxidoreductase subunit H
MLDEGMMGCWQKRIGPLNLGWVGLLAALLNGVNLVLANIIVPNLHVSLVFVIFPCIYFVFSMGSVVVLNPFMVFGS